MNDSNFNENKNEPNEIPVAEKSLIRNKSTIIEDNLEKTVKKLNDSQNTDEKKQQKYIELLYNKAKAKGKFFWHERILTLTDKFLARFNSQEIYLKTKQNPRKYILIEDCDYELDDNVLILKEKNKDNIVKMFKFQSKEIALKWYDKIQSILQERLRKPKDINILNSVINKSNIVPEPDSSNSEQNSSESKTNIEETTNINIKCKDSLQQNKSFKSVFPEDIEAIRSIKNDNDNNFDISNISKSNENNFTSDFNNNINVSDNSDNNDKTRKSKVTKKKQKIIQNKTFIPKDKYFCDLNDSSNKEALEILNRTTIWVEKNSEESHNDNNEDQNEKDDNKENKIKKDNKIDINKRFSIFTMGLNLIEQNNKHVNDKSKSVDITSNINSSFRNQSSKVVFENNNNKKFTNNLTITSPNNYEIIEDSKKPKSQDKTLELDKSQTEEICLLRKSSKKYLNKYINNYQKNSCVDTLNNFEIIKNVKPKQKINLKIIKEPEININNNNLNNNKLNNKFFQYDFPQTNIPENLQHLFPKKVELLSEKEGQDLFEKIKHELDKYNENDPYIFQQRKLNNYQRYIKKPCSYFYTLYTMGYDIDPLTKTSVYNEDFLTNFMIKQEKQDKLNKLKEISFQNRFNIIPCIKKTDTLKNPKISKNDFSEDTEQNQKEIYRKRNKTPSKIIYSKKNKKKPKNALNNSKINFQNISSIKKYESDNDSSSDDDGLKSIPISHIRNKSKIENNKKKTNINSNTSLYSELQQDTQNNNDKTSKSIDKVTNRKKYLKKDTNTYLNTNSNTNTINSNNNLNTKSGDFYDIRYYCEYDINMTDEQSGLENYKNVPDPVKNIYQKKKIENKNNKTYCIYNLTSKIRDNNNKENSNNNITNIYKQLTITQILESILKNRYNTQMLLFSIRQNSKYSTFIPRFKENLDKIIINENISDKVLIELLNNLPLIIRNRLNEKDICFIDTNNNSFYTKINKTSIHDSESDNSFNKYNADLVNQIKKIISNDIQFIINYIKEFYKEIPQNKKTAIMKNNLVSFLKSMNSLYNKYN